MCGKEKVKRLALQNYVLGQNYEVSDIQCSFSSTDSSIQDFIAAKLKKPPGFKADPIFADDRTVNPETDVSCHIQKSSNEAKEIYDLKITDFSRCGVLKRNGFVHVRIWFPQYPGVVMHSDQELIIMCKPPEPTVIENKAAGFAGSFPHGARVSGIVEETPGRLEYQVALYKEAPPVARINGLNTLVKEQSTTSELPVDQAVPIGTKLQLRARIGTQSVWKYIKLLEVTVSPDPDKPYANGAVWLVRNGCRNRDFASIIPHQPAKYRDRPYEVFLDFEAFLLSSMTERATLWIHSQIKACVEHTDCTPDFCMDLYEHSGHGRKRRDNILQNRLLNQNINETITELNMEMDDNMEDMNSDYARFEENLKYEVIMSDDQEQGTLLEFNSNDKNTCRNAIFMSIVLTIVLLISFMGVLYIIAVRIQLEQNLKTKYLFH